jgi:GT2 family glycosyltransferase
MVSLLGKDAKLGAVGSCIYYMDEPSRVQIWGGLKVNMLLGIPQIITDPSKASQVEYLVGASILLRRKVLEDIGLLDDKYFMYWDDADLGYRMRGLGWQIAIATESKIWHKWSTASDKKKKAKVDLLNSRAGVRFLTRYSPYPWLSIILGLSLRVFYRLLQRNLPAIHSLLLGTYQGIADLRKSKLLE